MSLDNTLDSENKQSLKNCTIPENDELIKVPEDSENTLNVSGLARELDAKLILGTPKQEPSHTFRINKWAAASPDNDNNSLLASDSFSPSSSDFSFVTAQDSFNSSACTSPKSPETLTVDETINLSSDSADTLNLTLDESIIPRVEKSELNLELNNIDCDKDNLKSQEQQKTTVENNDYCNSSVVSQDFTYLSAEESASEEGTSCYTSLENIYTTVIHNSQIDNTSNYDVSVVGLNELTQTVDYSINNFSTTTLPNQSCVDQHIEEIIVVEPNTSVLGIEDTAENFTENTPAETSTEEVDKEILNLSTHTITDSSGTISTTPSKSADSEHVVELCQQSAHDEVTKSLQTPTTETHQVEEIINNLSELNLKSAVQSETLDITKVPKKETPEISFEEVRASSYKINTENVIQKGNTIESVTLTQETKTEETSEIVPLDTAFPELVKEETVPTSVKDSRESVKSAQGIEPTEKSEEFSKISEVLEKGLVEKEDPKNIICLTTAPSELLEEFPFEVVKENSEKSTEQRKDCGDYITTALEVVIQDSVEILKDCQKLKEQEKKSEELFTVTPEVVVQKPVEILKEDSQEQKESSRKSISIDIKVPCKVPEEDSQELKEQEKNREESGTANLEANSQVPIDILEEDNKEPEKNKEVSIAKAPEVENPVSIEILKDSKELDETEEIVEKSNNSKAHVYDNAEIIKVASQEFNKEENESKEPVSKVSEIDQVPIEIVREKKESEELKVKTEDSAVIPKENCQDFEKLVGNSEECTAATTASKSVSVDVSKKNLEELNNFEKSVPVVIETVNQGPVEIHEKQSNEIKDTENKSEETKAPKVNNEVTETFEIVQAPYEIPKEYRRELEEPVKKSEQSITLATVPNLTTQEADSITNHNQAHLSKKASTVKSFEENKTVNEIKVDYVQQPKSTEDQAAPDCDFLKGNIENLLAKKIHETDSLLNNTNENLTQSPLSQISNITQRKKSLPKELKNQHNDSLGEFELIEAQLSSDQAEEEKCSSETSKALLGQSDTDLLQISHEQIFMDDENLNKSEAGPNIAEFSSEEFHSGDEDFLDSLAKKPYLSESELRKQSLFVQFDPILTLVSPVKQKPATVPTVNIMEEETLNDSKMSKISDLSENVNNLSLKSDNPMNGESATSTLNTEEFVKPKAPVSAKSSTSSDTEKDKLIEKLKKENAVYQKMLNDYENTITQCVNQRDSDKKQFEKYKKELENEKDEIQTHLRNSEIAFNDVHLKYERSKAIIEGLKANEDQLRASYAALEDELKKQVNKYDALKTHAISQLEKGNQELDLKIKTNEMETAKLKAMLKKSEMRCASLQESLTRKTQENAELTSICDDLISKVGQNV